MRNPDLIGSNRRALGLVILGIVLSLILFSMPLYSFNACVYTKKSPNTFVGDEKYRTVRAEVEQVADDYRAQGFAAEIGEDVLERVNSKGETTSLITFTVNQSLSKSPLSMLGCGFPASYVLAAMLFLMGLALVCAILGSVGTMDLVHFHLDRRTASLRNLAAVALLLALLLVPVFILMNNVAFSRRIALYNAGLLEEGEGRAVCQNGQAAL